jgi:hypothetical protein
MSEYIVDGVLTQDGQEVAYRMFNLQCDRRPCFMCSKQNRTTLGPGGPGCAAGELETRVKVDEVLTLYMGREPGMEAFTAFQQSLGKGRNSSGL